MERSQGVGSRREPEERMAVVLSYHGNRESEVALDRALRIAEARGSTLVVVLASKSDEEDPRTTEDAEDRLWHHLGEADVAFEVRHASAREDVADTVLEAARRSAADCIVLGLRPGGSARAVIGPTATRILLDAPCPVVTTTPRARS
jgi:nucleotide-binding universal stress UspA family protein